MVNYIDGDGNPVYFEKVKGGYAVRPKTPHVTKAQRKKHIDKMRAKSKASRKADVARRKN